MELRLSLVPLAGPAALAAVAAAAALRPGIRPRPVLALTRLAGPASLVAALVTALVVALRGPLGTAALGWGALSFSLRLDALTAVMLVLVAFLGAVILRFSRNYLDGDPRQGAFLGRLALTIACVMLLILSGTLFHLAFFWAATSFALHRLLLFYPERPGAVVAARKKFIVARAGDVLLAAAAVLLVRAFGTGDLGLLLERASSMAVREGVPASVHAAAALVALSAALKSAQFPTHGWLAEVMETPTPVSALLHAGILNGGTFLLARLGEVVLLSPPTLHLLVLVGGITALFGSVVMVTQSSVKVSLAYSSAAHMGFMLFLCGLGAFPVAILHLVAHSFYKAHAFLSSGSAVEVARASVVPGGKPAPSTLVLATAFGAALLTVAVSARALGFPLGEKPVALGLSSILALGLTQLLAQGMTGRPSAYVVARSVVGAVGVTLAFFLLEAGAETILHGAVPNPAEPSATTVVLMASVVALFAAVSLLQLLLPRYASRGAWAAAWVHARNGFYANTLFDRLVGALRPVNTPSPATETGA